MTYVWKQRSCQAVKGDTCVAQSRTALVALVIACVHFRPEFCFFLPWIQFIISLVLHHYCFKVLLILWSVVRCLQSYCGASGCRVRLSVGTPNSHQVQIIRDGWRMGPGTSDTVTFTYDLCSNRMSQWDVLVCKWSLINFALILHDICNLKFVL